MKYLKNYTQMVQEKYISDVDKVLDKISKYGIDSLTADEKECLTTGKKLKEENPEYTSKNFKLGIINFENLLHTIFMEATLIYKDEIYVGSVVLGKNDDYFKIDFYSRFGEISLDDQEKTELINLVKNAIECNVR